MNEQTQYTSQRDFEKERIETAFKSIPLDKDQLARCASLRKLSENLASVIHEACPKSREKSLAQTKLEECLMWAIKSIAVNE